MRTTALFADYLFPKKSSLSRSFCVCYSGNKAQKYSYGNVVHLKRFFFLIKKDFFSEKRNFIETFSLEAVFNVALLSS